MKTLFFSEKQTAGIPVKDIVFVFVREPGGKDHVHAFLIAVFLQNRRLICSEKQFVRSQNSGGLFKIGGGLSVRLRIRTNIVRQA